MPRIPFFTIPCFIPRDYSVISAPNGGSGMPRIPFFTIPCFIPRDFMPARDRQKAYRHTQEVVSERKNHRIRTQRKEIFV